MSGNEINEMFSYLTKEGEAPIERVRQLYKAIYKEDVFEARDTAGGLSKSQFAVVFQKAMKSERIEEELLFLFYHLDREKKGFLSPEDVFAMFEVVGRKISLHEIENSFKYAKVHKNRMSFEDFREYFHNF